MISDIVYRSDNLLEFNGAVNESTAGVIDGATVTASIFEEDADTSIKQEVFKLAANAAPLATTLQIVEVPKVTVAVGDTVRVELDDGTHHTTTVDAGSSTTTIVLVAGLPSAASKSRNIALLTKVTGVTQLVVASCEMLYEIGDTISVRAADGTFQVLTISDIDFANSILTVSATTADINTLASVSKKLGADIVMSLYGTPVAGDFDWGYRGILPDTHPGIEVGKVIRVEITVDGGADLKLVDIHRLPVVESRLV